MRFLDVVGGVVTNALDFVIEKNKIQAQINRLRLVMRKETQLMDKSYIALGKYYYENLRENSDNVENEKICQVVDKSKVRMEKARTHCRELIDLQAEEYATITIDADEGDITVCCSYDDVNAAEEPQAESPAVDVTVATEEKEDEPVKKASTKEEDQKTK